MNIVRNEVTPRGIYVVALVNANEIRFDRTVGNGGPTAQNVDGEVTGRDTIGNGPFLVKFTLEPENGSNGILAAGMTVLNYPKQGWWTQHLPARLRKKV